MARNGKNIHISPHGSGRKVVSKRNTQPGPGDKRYIRRDDDDGEFAKFANGSEGKILEHSERSAMYLAGAEGSGVMRMTVHHMNVEPIRMTNFYGVEAQKEGYSAVFSDKAAYDRSVDLVTARIKSGAIKARTPDE